MLHGPLCRLWGEFPQDIMWLACATVMVTNSGRLLSI